MFRKTHAYEKWNITSKIFWWIIFPFYFIFNFEPLIQYYKNFCNLKKYLYSTTKEEDENMEDVKCDNLKKYVEGVLTATRLKWLEAMFEAVPQFTLQIFVWSDIYIQSGVWICKYCETRSNI